MEAVTAELATERSPFGGCNHAIALSCCVTMQIRLSLCVNLGKSVERFFCVPCSFSLNG